MSPFQNPGRSAVYGDTHMAATSHPASSAVAYLVLEGGGNAVDAAIAASAVLCVAEPHMTGVEGDCFVLYAPAGEQIIALNGSGRAPGAVDAGKFRDLGMAEIAADSPYAVTIPGAVDAWCRLHADYGSMPLEQLLAPAISLAEEGCIIAPRVAHDWQTHRDKLFNSPSTRDAFLKRGAPYAVGDRFQNPALGMTLRRIVADGRDGFYQGEVAQGMVDFLNGIGGVHTIEDLAEQKCEYVAPISTHYQGHEIFECPPNGQGIIALLILNILEQFEDDYSEAENVHLLAESTKLAYQHRDAFVADPSKADVPVEMLLSKNTAINLAEKVSKIGRAHV